MDKIITLSTIGFTKKTAKEFFNMLKDNKITKVIDIRLNNTSQIAGFAKQPNLQYFLKELANIEYQHITDFTPSKELLHDYQHNNLDWDKYIEIFNNLLKVRDVERNYKVEDFNNCCFLCSEQLPDFCHRRLVVEFLAKNKDNVIIKHII